MPLLDRQPPRPDGWPPTLWGVVATLDQREHPQWQDSWRALVAAYTAPMEAYARRVLSRRRGKAIDPGEAAEVVQDFLATCVEKGWLSRADPQRGRFRAYLQTLLARHVGRMLRHAAAQKRGPAEGRAVLPLGDEDAAGDPALEVGHDEDRVAFDREWVGLVVARALARLRAHNERYAILIQDLIDTEGAGSPGMAALLGQRPQQVAVSRHRARQRFQDFVVQELRATVSDPAAFEEEWRALLPYLP